MTPLPSLALRTFEHRTVLRQEPLWGEAGLSLGRPACPAVDELCRVAGRVVLLLVVSDSVCAVALPGAKRQNPDRKSVV